MSNLFKSGAGDAKKAQEQQMRDLKAQKQQEELKTAEEEDEIGRRKALSATGVGGRSSLIKTSQTGLKATTGS
jgi:hypothetical protein